MGRSRSASSSPTGRAAPLSPTFITHAAEIAQRDGVGGLFNSNQETSTAWPSNLDHAWWGYETLDDVSNHGHASGVGNINLTQMGYSIPGNSGFWYRQPTTSAIIWTGTGCNSNRVKTILSTYYSSDTLDVKTTWRHPDDRTRAAFSESVPRVGRPSRAVG